MKNVGTVDRVARGVLAAVLLGGALAAGAGTALGIVLLVLAAVMAVTAAAGWCPLYRALHVETCTARRSKAEA